MEHVSKDIKEINTRSMKTIIRVITPPPQGKKLLLPTRTREIQDDIV